MCLLYQEAKMLRHTPKVPNKKAHDCFKSFPYCKIVKYFIMNKSMSIAQHTNLWFMNS